MESRLRKYKRKQQPRKRPGFKSPLNPPNFLVSSGLDLVIYCANVWNEREADNVRERRDFEEDEVKSHLGLSSAQPFNCFISGWNEKSRIFSSLFMVSFILFTMIIECSYAHVHLFLKGPSQPIQCYCLHPGTC